MVEHLHFFGFQIVFGFGNNNMENEAHNYVLKAYISQIFGSNALP